jgi:hypothetical protein
MSTSSPDHAAGAGTSVHADVAELFGRVLPIRSVEDLASAEVFDTDTEVDEFLGSVRASRDADLA